MVYELTIEKELEEELNELKRINIREYTILQKKFEEMKLHASVIVNHKAKFNSFEKPLQDYKWIEINEKILIFKVDPNYLKIHLCEYLPKDEVFQ